MVSKVIGCSADAISSDPTFLVVKRPTPPVLLQLPGRLDRVRQEEPFNPAGETKGGSAVRGRKLAVEKGALPTQRSGAVGPASFGSSQFKFLCRLHNFVDDVQAWGVNGLYFAGGPVDLDVLYTTV